MSFRFKFNRVNANQRKELILVHNGSDLPVSSIIWKSSHTDLKSGTW